MPVEPGKNHSPMIAFVFPGQGSQEVGMGYELCRTSPQAKQVFDEADDALSIPLSQLCFNGPMDELRETINSQPAILTASVAYLRGTPELNYTIRPAFVAGHSLGEYTALVAANVLDFADAVRLVRERGRLMHEAGKRNPGTMAAIIGLDEASVDEVCRETGAQIANVNCPGQTVVSGTREAVAQSMDLAQRRGAVGTVALEVSGAFHSVLMEPVVEEMKQAISQVHFRPSEIPIIANSTATPMTSVEEIKEELIRQLCSCVRWQASVECMAEAGVSTFVEIGPGIVLTKLIKRTAKGTQALNVSDPESVKALCL